MDNPIDFEQIPKIQLDILCRTLLSAMERFYADPENLRRFEEWLESEEGKAYIQRQEAKQRQSETCVLE